METAAPQGLEVLEALVETGVAVAMGQAVTAVPEGSGMAVAVVQLERAETQDMEAKGGMAVMAVMAQTS